MWDFIPSVWQALIGSAMIIGILVVGVMKTSSKAKKNGGGSGGSSGSDNSGE